MEANAELYRNIEVILRCDYRHGKNLKPFAGELITSTSNSRFVYQQDLAYYSVEESGKVADGSSYSVETFFGFDGVWTRLVDQVVNKTMGRVESSKFFRPHTLLLDGAWLRYPLALYLGGEEAIRTHPVGRLMIEDEGVSVRVEGEDVINGLHCIKLRGKRWMRSLPDEGEYRFIWLATDRNYLPIKVEGYYPPRSGDRLPFEVAQTEEMREIAPGVWFPFRTSLTIYIGYLLKENKSVVYNVTEYTIEKAELDPHYDISLFRDIPFPEGLPVYVIKNGEIVESYVQGQRESDGSASTPWIWVVIGHFLALVAIIMVWVRRRRRRQTEV